MQRLRQHVVRCFVAGVAALLPIAGLVFTVVYFEGLIAGSWLRQSGFYFFGLGLLILLVLLYLVGLVVTTVIGRWMWSWIDVLLDRLPLVGNLYQTLKQMLGYGEGPNALFRRAVLVSATGGNEWELGLVTRDASPETQGRVTVFIPYAPSLTSGRLVMIAEASVHPCPLTVSQTMQMLVSIGAMGENASSQPPSPIEPVPASAAAAARIDSPPG